MSFGRSHLSARNFWPLPSSSSAPARICCWISSRNVSKAGASTAAGAVGAVAALQCTVLWPALCAYKVRLIRVAGFSNVLNPMHHGKRMIAIWTCLTALTWQQPVRGAVSTHLCCNMLAVGLPPQHTPICRMSCMAGQRFKLRLDRFAKRSKHLSAKRV